MASENKIEPGDTVRYIHSNAGMKGVVEEIRNAQAYVRMAETRELVQADLKSLALVSKKEITDETA